MTQEHFDVIIVGSGLSGIDAGYHVQTYCRNKSYVILESRDAIGGTWDLLAIPAFAPIRTCTPSAIRFVLGSRMPRLRRAD